MEIIMAKYGEIALKGQNKRTFEDILIKNVRLKLNNLGEFDYTRMQSTLYIKPKSQEINLDEAVNKLLKVFGIGAVQRCLELPKDFAEIKKSGIIYLKNILDKSKTFKVEAKRSDKNFHMRTPEIQRELGAAVLETYPHLSVDVHNPEITVILEIRDNYAYLNAEKLKGAGGIPVGSSGIALLLLSGGIDSPVAAYMTAKRGLIVEAVHFQSPPYTSKRALMKVEKLCEILSEYCGKIKLNILPFTEIQETLRDNCMPEFFTIILRRLMIRIANEICDKGNARAIVTGESVGQVASQTLPAINCTNAVAKYPVFRPVIGMDKIEITEIARKIGTFETSILPYEDCCTIFSPKHPRTNPKLYETEKEEARFDYSEIIKKAVNNINIKIFNI